ncbi:tRNA epoxyqueuosine(34) reductase QueG [Sedimentibacter hydroxybenzoicus DSM 7310]|uniref:tRNA epoxyqueuosine(34) reductase QueG n=1 Tax=Sedimentibacter hydroxybenzoicus DSM 7310 TaxID=1123245 RepID=A0A974BLE3_SEDHY|nr:tRNA epoxyqueuosine(34) reductase QueG [Sedimentibacter hydroxybenzoicus]NYB75510.1 tRNA epoxyqueuosine(34) reductase QueG [Sedimentibacter hydroxybenzoicus DSM 7310]
MKQKITEIANSMGIDIIGFTSLLDYGYLKDLLINRADKEYNSEFEENEINKRLDVRNILPECKSIIAIGIPYAEGYKKPVTKDMGLLSVSSYGIDYHKKLSGILYNLAEEIKKHKCFEYVICVDTSPLIDKEICKNAQLGNYGKNSLLINDRYGSFIHLGYLLTDLDIENSKTIGMDICGECDICVKSCPNNAIFKNGGLNSKKCVSYLTQTKNYIPVDYRKSMSNQIYGCDVCQLVCPKNRLNSEKDTKNDYRSLLVDLNELMHTGNRDFIKKYGALSGSWRGKNVWKRNGLIATGNLQLLSMYDTVKEELGNPSELIRIYAAWSLLKLKKEDARDVLNNKLKYEDDKIKREYMKLMELEL